MSNTITAYFKGRKGVAESLYQNDYGMVMVFDGIELPAHFDCYFSVPGSDTATAAIGADNMVVIPNSVLGNSGSMSVHIPLHTGSNDSEVEYVAYFKVIGRARPEDDGTPAQMTAIEQALALLQQPITNIEEIVNEALSFTGDTFAEMQEQLDEDQAAFKAEIRDDIADVEHDFDILDGQFQTAVAAITVDSEVQGIRTGDDGVTYTSAGEAVRKQFSKATSNFSKAGITEVPTFTETEGMINSGGSVLGSLPDRHTSPILLNTGDTIRFYGYNYSSFCIISESLDNSFLPLVNANSNGYATTEYTATRPIYVVCSGTKSDAFIITVVRAVQDEIDTMASALELGGISGVPDYTVLSGAVNSNGSVIGSTPDRHTSPILLNEGDEIVCSGYTYSGFCIIAEYVENSYKPIINSTENSYKVTRYTAERKMYAVCSALRSAEFIVTVNRAISSEIDSIKNHLEENSIISAFNTITNQIKKNRAYKSENYRPLYHMTPNSKWMNDPHGFVYYKGLYHIYYQHNDDINNGNSKQRWGHFVSDDLITWQEHPDAFERSDGSCWDGTCIVDADDLLGLGADTLLQFYTFVPSGTSQQDLCLAYSTDDGETFQSYSNEPIISWASSGQSRVFRDPKIIYDSTHNKYVLVIAVDAGVAFYSSTDLINWTYLSTFNSLDTTKTTECARLCIVDGEWVLIYSYRWNSQYWFIGEWDGTTFTSTYSGRLGYGEGYAFEVSSNTDKVYGVQFFNPNTLVNTVIGDPYAMNSNGILSTVCELSIVDNAVCMNPIIRANRNVVSLPSTKTRLYETELGVGNSVQIKLHASIESDCTMEFTVKFNADDEGYDLVTFGFVSGLLDFYRGDEKYYSSAGFDRITSCTIDTSDLTEFDLNIIVDVGCVEVYALGGRYAILGKTFNTDTIDKKITLKFHGDNFEIDNFEVNPIITSVPNKYILT